MITLSNYVPKNTIDTNEGAHHKIFRNIVPFKNNSHTLFKRLFKPRVLSVLPYANGLLVAPTRIDIN